MRIVVDTNIIISSLIRDSITRHIITFLEVSFYYPEQSFNEVIRNKGEILEKSNMSEDKFNLILATLFKYINIVKQDEIHNYLAEADKIIGKIHKNDVPFVAAALAKNAIIWSNDAHFTKQDQVVVVTTHNLINNYKKIQRLG